MIMKKFCCYETINLINGKFYRGKALTKNVLYNDYIGSGTLLKQAIKKYGKDNFKCTIVEYFDLESEAYKYEQDFVILNLQISYNLKPGGKGGKSNCIVMNNGTIQTRVNKDLIEDLKHNGWVLGELKKNFNKRRSLAKKALEEKYGICTGAMITAEAKLKSKNTHVQRYGNECGHMHTADIIEKSLETRTKKYGSPCAACHTKEIEELASKRSHETLLKKYGNITGKLHTEESQKLAHKNAQITFNRQKTVIMSSEFLEWWQLEDRTKYKSKRWAVKDFLKETNRFITDYPETIDNE